MKTVEKVDMGTLPEALEVKHIQMLLDCGRRQAYELVNSGKFHIVRVGNKIKVSKRLFFEWYEGKEFGEWLEVKKRG